MFKMGEKTGHGNIQPFEIRCLNVDTPLRQMIKHVNREFVYRRLDELGVKGRIKAINSLGYTPGGQCADPGNVAYSLRSAVVAAAGDNGVGGGQGAKTPLWPVEQAFATILAKRVDHFPGPWIKMCGRPQVFPGATGF